ncbi:unnamed protein product [Darwinula stevensoni]|uniref:K Homology domain-containing protein n=1 Tax=Darwinula stevensoni TaxID=69355 RepID=A0A7R8WYU3_9CRUS|nr:unnamed protein product [Darwinula stevensoni]CAG0879778.1 unnamed protein product [Darwinula stevensoni]
MGENNTNNNPHSIADYLAQLLKDKKQLAALPNVFLHVERLLDEEIGKVRGNLFQINGHKREPLVLPEGQGATVTLSEKVYVPNKEHPDFNFVGRILGPRGMTAKQLEQETGCKIMVRGKGSMRDKKKEEMNRGKPNWEHLNDDLHVLITVEDYENRAKVKLQRAVEEIKKLLVPAADGEDELKKRQLMELAIINGTYRDSSSKNANGELGGMTFMGSQYAMQCQEKAVDTYSSLVRLTASLGAMVLRLRTADGAPLMCAALDLPRLMAPLTGLGASPLRQAVSTPLGAPLILSSRLPVPTSAAALLNGTGAGNPGPPPLITAAGHGDTSGLLYAPYTDYAGYAALAASPLLAEYAAAAAADHAGGLFAR